MSEQLLSPIPSSSHPSRHHISSRIPTHSKYPLLSISEAHHRIRDQCMKFNVMRKIGVERVDLMKALNRTLAMDVSAAYDIPQRPCSMMDGYALRVDSLPKRHGDDDTMLINVTEHASTPGDAPVSYLPENTACYITTGGVLPENASLVVPVEQTEALDSHDSSYPRRIRISGVSGLRAKKFVRATGSDVKKGETVLRKGQILRSAELGILAQLGVATVQVHKTPVVAIMSTGNELVEYSAPVEEESKVLVRDCNRLLLHSCLKEMNLDLHIIDYGIMKDNKHDVETALKQAIRHANIVITTGGVSMGSMDYVKPILEDIAEVHFGRVRMKPGKPTTFATTELMDEMQLVFALPGNPVSAIVGFHLFVEPAVHYTSGNESWHHPLMMSTVTHDIRMDPERPEYHRCRVAWESTDQKILSRGTGHQQSSRLLSAANSNGMLIIPQGDGIIKAGSEVTTLMTGQPERLSPEEVRVWTSAAQRAQHHGHHHKHEHKHDSHSPPIASHEKTIINVGIVTVSDRVHAGTMEDRSMPEIQRFFEEQNLLSGATILWEVIHTVVVPDEEDLIRSTLLDCCKREHLHLVLTSGGTGFSPRDVTPDATAAVVKRRADALITACLIDGLKTVPSAMLSRAIAGIRDNTLIVNLPGSPRAVRQNLETLTKGRLEHALKLMLGKNTQH